MLARFYIGCNCTQPVLLEGVYFLILCLNHPNILGVNTYICKGGAHSHSADTAGANADEDVAVVSKSFCFSCPPTIVDEQCKVKVTVKVMI
jgi:hypothetical protein